MNISSNPVGNCNDENNFLGKFLLINTQVSNLRKAFANGSSANIKLLKTQLQKIGQSRGVLGRLLRSLLKSRLPLAGNVLKLLAKSILISLGLTVIASATNGAIHKKMFRSGATISIISNDEMNDIAKIVKSLEKFGLLIKSVSQTIKNEGKEQKIAFLEMLLGTLGASLLGNPLTGKGTIRAGKGTTSSYQDF